MIKKLTSLLFITFFAININAQSEEFVFKNYDIQNGLCDNNINSIAQDGRGFIWIGTREGLSRFDGAEFRNFFINGNYSWLQSIGYNKILLLNNHKLCLLNTSNNGIQIIEKFKNYEILEITKLNHSLFSLNAKDRFILVDSKLNLVGEIKIPGKIYSNIFIRKLTLNKFLIGNCFDYYEYNFLTQKLNPFKLDMRKYENKNFNIFQLKFIDDIQQEIYIDDYFTGLYIFDYNGNLLNHYDRNFKENYISSSNIITFIRDKEGGIWIATQNGINLIRKNKNTIIQHQNENDLSLKSNVISTFFLDKNNNLWIGTNQGISVYKNKLNTNIGNVEITDEHLVSPTTIVFENNKIYAGEYLNKVYVIDQVTKKIDILKSKTKVWGLYNFENKIIISGANPDHEVENYDPKTNTLISTNFLKKFYPNTDIVTLVYQHSNGDYWYSGNAGGGFVRKLAKSDKTIQYYKDYKGKPLFASSYYSEVCEDVDKNLWFGMIRSELLLQWNYKTNNFREIDFNVLLKKKTVFGGITDLKVDSNNIIWVSFEGGGIIKFNPKTNAVKQYSSANGLNTNFINDLELDLSNRLWLLTSKGISCLDPKTDKFYVMNIWDGFIDSPMNYNMLKMNLKTKTMWVGALNGLRYFNPDIILNSKKNSTILFLDYLKINDESTINLEAKEFNFKPNENNLEFRLVAVDIENGKNLEYSYQLSGLSKQWYNLNSNRTVIFQKLKSGKYTFKARVRNKGSKDWVFLSKPFTFQIAVIWYETWWFYSLLTFVIVLILFRIISSYFSRKLKKQRNELEKQKLIEGERKRIAKDMHDDLGSGLTKITYLSQMVLQSNPNEELITNINKTSIELVESMSEIIWVMKDENNNWEELLFFIKKYAVEYCSNNNINIVFDYPEIINRKEISGEKRRNIYLSVKEVLHNIVKHANANKVIITVNQNTKTSIIISDNGIGIDFSNTNKNIGGNGLKNIQERMNLIKGTVTIENNNGTQIRFIIPN